MKRSFVMTFVFCVLALLFFMPTASHAKRGLPDYVVDKTYGDTNTGPRVLFAYATYYGSTYRIAEVICEVLSAEGYKIDLKSAENITGDLADYDAVILGSSIYIENWNTKATAFLDKYQSELSTKKVAYFCVCMVLGMDFGGKEEEYADGYFTKIKTAYPLIVPVASTPFAGAVDYKILKPKDWLLMRFIMFAQPGNWTDYAGVVSWAFEVSDKFK